MSKKKRTNKVIQDLRNIENFSGCFEKLGEPNQVAILEDFLNKDYDNQVVNDEPKTNLSEEMEKEFETLCLQGMLILPESIFQLPIEQRDLYIRSLLNNFKDMEKRNQVSSTNVYYITKQCSYRDCLANTESEGTTFREKSISLFKSYWYKENETIPNVKPYEVKINKNIGDSNDMDIDSEVQSIMKINASKKKKNEVKIADGVLTQEQRLSIGDEMLSKETYGLNLTDDPTKPGIWYNIFTDDVSDLVARVHTKDVNGKDFTYNNRRIDFRYIPDWYWQRWFVKPFKGSLSLEWNKTTEDFSIPSFKAMYSGSYFDNHPTEVMASEFLSNAEASITNATMALATKLTKEKKATLSGNIKGIPENGWTKDFIESLKTKGFGRRERYINYCDSNAKHAYQDERLSLKRRNEAEGFDLMRSTPSNCNTAKAFILAHRQLLKGATLVFENGREFDNSPWGQSDPMFFDKVKNPLGFESGFDLYLGICSGIAKYQGVKIPRYAGQSLVVGVSPFNKIKKLEQELNDCESKKERKKIKKRIKKIEKNSLEQIKAGNSNVVMSYEKAADWKDVYQFIPEDFVEPILDSSIDVDEFIDKYRENERKKYDPNFLPQVYPEEFFEKVNPTTWITDEVRHKMHRVLADSTLEDFQKNTGSKIINDMEKMIIGKGKDPDTLQMVAKFNKSRKPDENRIKKSLEYKWATETSVTYRGRLSAMIRRGADEEIIPALMGVYKLAEQKYSVSSLIGDKPSSKSIGDYAIELLVERGIISETDDQFITDEEVIGANSHFVDVYKDIDDVEIDKEIEKIRDNMSTFTSTKKKHLGEKQSKNKRFKKAKNFDEMFTDNKSGGSIKINGEMISNVSYYANLANCANNDIDDFVEMCGDVASSISNSTGQRLPKYFKDKLDNKQKRGKHKSKKKLQAKLVKERKKALEDGKMDPLQFIEELIVEDEVAQKTKKGSAKKKKRIAESIVAKSAGESSWERLSEKYNPKVEF